MYLDNRSKTLFQEVIKNPNITNKQLEVKYKLSRYQISYSFQKVKKMAQVEKLSRSKAFQKRPIYIRTRAYSAIF